MDFQPQGAPYEYEGNVPGTNVWAQINKIGGGTPPREYTGAWEYVLRVDDSTGPVLSRGTDLNIPLPATHAKAAKVAFEFINCSDWEAGTAEEAEETGRVHGWSHANYCEAYGGDENEEPIVPLRFASVASEYVTAYALGVERFADGEDADGTPRESEA